MAPRLLALLLLALPLHAEEPFARFRGFVPGHARIEELPPAPQEAFVAASEAQGGDFGVEIQLEVKRGPGAFRPVPLDTPVCDGDFIALRFTPSETGFVTVLNHGTSGAWSTVWPQDTTEKNSFSPQQPVRLPADPTEGFPVLPPAPGREYMLLFLSPDPFSRKLADFRDALLNGTAPSEDEPPRISYVRTRDVGGATSAFVVARGEQKVVFHLEHAIGCPALP